MLSKGKEGCHPFRLVEKKNAPYDEKRVDIAMVKIAKEFIQNVKKEVQPRHKWAHKSKAEICKLLCDPGEGILHRIDPANSAIFNDLLRAELYEQFPYVIPRFGAKCLVDVQNKGLAFFGACCLPEIGLLPLEDVWLWLASFANDIRSICQDENSIDALYTVLSITWRALWTNYDERFLELLIVIKRDVFPYLVHPDMPNPENIKAWPAWPWDFGTNRWNLEKAAKDKKNMSNLLMLLEALPNARIPFPSKLPDLCAECLRNGKKANCEDCKLVLSFFLDVDE